MFLSQVRRDATPLRAALTAGLGYLRVSRSIIEFRALTRAYAAW
jgi:hypothetical protein